MTEHQINDAEYFLKKYKEVGSTVNLYRLKSLVDSLVLMEVNHGLENLGHDPLPIKSVSTPKKSFVYNISFVEKVIDGDSIEAVLDLGFNIFHRVAIRLSGIDTPEKNTPEGKLVKTYVEEWFKTGTFTVNSKELDKYGRVLGTITRVNGEYTVELGSLLISKGFARVYNGEKKVDWTEAQLTNIREALQIKE